MKYKIKILEEGLNYLKVWIMNAEHIDEKFLEI